MPLHVESLGPLVRPVDRLSHVLCSPLSRFPPICCLLDSLGLTVHSSHPASRILGRMNLNEKRSVRIIVPVVEEVGCTCRVETLTLNSCFPEGVIAH